MMAIVGKDVGCSFSGSCPCYANTMTTRSGGYERAARLLCAVWNPSRGRHAAYEAPPRCQTPSPQAPVIGGKAAIRHPGDDKPNTRSDIDQGVQQQVVFKSARFVGTIVHLRATAPQVRWYYGATTRVFPRNYV